MNAGLKALKNSGKKGQEAYNNIMKYMSEGGRPGILFGTREKIEDEEGNVIGNLRNNSKLRELISGSKGKISLGEGGRFYKFGGKMYEDGGVGDPPKLTQEQSALMNLLAEATANPGQEVTGSTASPALKAGLGYTTAVDATAAPMRAIVIPPGESTPEEGSVSAPPEDMAPMPKLGIDPMPREGGPKLLKRNSREQESEDMDTYTWTPERGQMDAVTPGRGFVTTGKDGSPKQINFSTESLAKYLFENQRPTGKVKIVGRDSAGRPITEKQMPFASIEDAYKKAESMSSQNIPGAKKYDIFEFIQKSQRPSGVRTYQ